jgi:hypothetical protein
VCCCYQNLFQNKSDDRSTFCEEEENGSDFQVNTLFIQFSEYEAWSTCVVCECLAVRADDGCHSCTDSDDYDTNNQNKNKDSATDVDNDSGPSLEGLRFLRVSTPLERSIQTASDPTCTVDCCQQFEASICPASDNAWINAIPLWIQILLVLVLIAASSLFAGLTLGSPGAGQDGT